MHHVATTAMLTLMHRGTQLCIIPQNLIEFWNVATRPVERNGLGYNRSSGNTTAALNICFCFC